MGAAGTRGTVRRGGADVSVLIIGGMTVDDIVLREGSVHRRVAGGNALYAALGSALWGVGSQLVSFIGEDYPTDALHELESRGVRVEHVSRVEGSSVRLWILYEHDGRRQIHLQHGSPSLEPLAAVAEDALRAVLDGADTPAAAHVAALPVRTQRSMASALRNAGIRFSLDTLEAKGSVGGDLASYLEPGADMAPTVFLPSREEFSVIFGDTTSPTFRSWAAGTATEALVLKDGAGGSHLSCPPGAPPLSIPVIESHVVDPTGAGDAYCGGYIAGMSRGASPYECALMGTVSASFVIEDVGAAGLLEATVEDAQARRDSLYQAISGDH